MAKIKIQHLYTTGSTIAPVGLIEGEIAISHATENEAIFLKPREEAGKAAKEIKFIPEVRIKKMFEEAGIGSNDVITGLSTQLSEHIAVSGSTSNFGHVQLVSGNVQNITAYRVGEAAASCHTHGQYLEENSLNTNNGGFEMILGYNNNPDSYVVKAGTGITVDANGVSINDEYQGKIANGVTAYDWGDHATKGYAKNDDLTAHRNNTSIHVEPSDKVKWNDAANRINTFLDVKSGATEALDSLYEIQQFLDGTGSTVQKLIDNLSGLTDTVDNNTTAITKNSNDIAILKQNFEDNGTVSILQHTVERKVETIDVSGNLSATTGTTSIGSRDKKYTITHTTAGTQKSAITATNDTTGLSFGSEFKIVDNIGYDANGHVVSGSTQTLKLPIVNQASSEREGIVTTTSGDLKDYTDIPTKSQLHYAAHRNHTHSQYVRFTDLSANTGNIITISCGTY